MTISNHIILTDPVPDSLTLRDMDRVGEPRQVTLHFAEGPLDISFVDNEDGLAVLTRLNQRLARLIAEAAKQRRERAAEAEAVSDAEADIERERDLREAEDREPF